MTAVAYKAAMTALASTVWIHCTITFRQRKKSVRHIGGDRRELGVHRGATVSVFAFL